MSETGLYTIRALSPELLNDYLAFFDQDAFADNPRWGFCYCYFNHAPHHLMDWNQRTASENRSSVSDLIRDNQMHGYLAYFDGKPVGWCNAASRTQMTNLPDDEDLPVHRIGSIVCFIIAKPYRGRGIARRLLEAACEGFCQQGFELAEAYPFKGAQGDAANHYGPLTMYLAAGFEPYREVDGVMIVRKKLS
jgi:GNAT superfamily N-acetyltransferase